MFPAAVAAEGADAGGAAAGAKLLAEGVEESAVNKPGKGELAEEAGHVQAGVGRLGEWLAGVLAEDDRGARGSCGIDDVAVGLLGARASPEPVTANFGDLESAIDLRQDVLEWRAEYFDDRDEQDDSEG